jgi:ribosomal protein L32E
VSACAFIVDGVQPQGVASVIISTREFKSADAASSAYAILTKVSDKNRKTINNNAFYSTSAKQMVTIKDAKITTITVSLASNAATPDKSFFEQFLDLL